MTYLRFTSLRLLPLLALMLLATGCRKNQFTLTGSLDGGAGSTVYMCWRAASGTRDFMASQAVPLTASQFTVEGPVKKPSVIWFFSSGRKLLRAIYVERGDHITISGPMASPLLWKVEGNDVMEEVTAWAGAHEAQLRGGSPGAVNAAVASFVKEHPGSRASLFLLFTLYDRALDAPGFSRMLAGCSDKEMLAEMRAACLEPVDASALKLPEAQERRIKEVLEPDSTASDTLPEHLRMKAYAQ